MYRRVEFTKISFAEGALFIPRVDGFVVCLGAPLGDKMQESKREHLK
jgi:hypothetical protein